MSKMIATLALPLLLVGGLALTVPAVAAEKAAEKTTEKAAPAAANKADLSAAVAGEYQLDPAHTNVFFRLAHLGFSGYMGRFNKIEGKVKLDPKDVAKSGLDVTIDAASIDVNNEKLQGELRDKEVFDTAAYPNITFKATKLEQKDVNRGTITGDLTLHGVTKPVTLDVTLNGVGVHPMTQKPTLGFSATATIKRSDFGITKWAQFVGDSVQIIIETEIQQ